MMTLSRWKRAARVVGAAMLVAVLGSGAFAASTSVVVSEVMVADSVGGTTKSGGEFIELRNVTNEPIDIGGYKIVYRSATNSTPVDQQETTALHTVPNGTSLPANGFYLIATTTYQTDHAGTTVNGTLTAGTSGALSGAGGGVGLRNAAGTLIDSLGYGTATNAFVETAAATVPPAGSSAERIPTGVSTTDTDNNFNDFIVQANPTPTSTPVVVNVPSVTSVLFSPAQVNPGDSFISITATVAPGDNPTISTVTADLTPIGGAASLPLTYSGIGNDWTGSFDVPAAATYGTKTITVTAKDAANKTGTGTGSLIVNYTGPTLTVAQARALNEPTIQVPVHGIVVTNSVGNAYIADPDGNAGITIFDGTPNDGTSGTEQGTGNVRPLVPGDVVDAKGMVYVYNGELELDAGAGAGGEIQIVGTGQPIPTAKPLTIPQVTGNDTYEGQLISFSNVTVVTAPAMVGSNAWTFIVEDASSNQITVYVHKNATTLANTPPGPTTNPIPAAGDVTPTLTGVQPGNVYNLSGMLSEYSSQTPPKQLKPRNAGDMTLIKTSLIVSATATPSIVERGGTLTLTVRTAPQAGSTVTANLTALGGAADVALPYNSATGSYTTTVPVTSATPLGQWDVIFSASNPGYNAGEVVTTKSRITVTTPAQVMTIAQARAVDDWAQVTVSGEVTANTVGTGAIYFQDATGGIYMFGGTGTGFTANPGDKVTVTGFKRTFSGSVEVDYTSLYNASSNPTITGFGAPTITPKPITQAQWGDNPAILSVTGSLYIIRDTSGTSANKTYIVTDGTSTGEIFISSKANFGTADLPVVGQAYTVTGVVDRYISGSRNTWQIKPRQPSDVVAGTAPAVIPAQIAFTTQPVGGQPGAALATQPSITVQTASGQTATTYSGPVTVALKSGTGTSGAKLTGTTTVNAVNGVATFTDLSVDLAGTDYVLTGTVYGLTAVSSAAFTVGSAAVPGDVDKSGAVTLDDVRLALSIAGGLVSGTDASVSFPNADVDNSGSVTVEDAVAIRRLIP